MTQIPPNAEAAPKPRPHPQAYWEDCTIDVTNPTDRELHKPDGRYPVPLYEPVVAPSETVSETVLQPREPWPGLRELGRRSLRRFFGRDLRPTIVEK